MTRVLVTGAQGLLGSSLVPYLRAQGYQLVLHARNGEGDVSADLTDADQTSAALDETMPDVIVNMAALTDVDECEREPHQAYLANVRVVENLAKWMQNNGSSCRLVQLSTDHVYDSVGPHKEDNVVLRNYYGFSKYMGELVAATVPSTILRTNFFGPSQCARRMSLSDWMVQSLVQRKAITVFDDVRFSPLSIQSLVKMLELVIAKRVQGLFNLGSREGMSKAEFAFTLAEVLDLPTEYMNSGISGQVRRAAHRPKDMRMNSSRFEYVFSVELPTLRQEIHSMKAAYAHETR